MTPVKPWASEQFAPESSASPRILAAHTLKGHTAEPMRIALVSYDFGEYCIQHANGLLDHGDVLLVIPSQLFEPHEAMLAEKVECRTFAKPRLRQPLRQLRVLRQILKYIAEFKPDVIHFQLGHMWFNFVVPLLRRRYPVVYTVHDARQHLGDRGAQKTPQWVMDFGYRCADQVIVHSSHLTQILVDEVGLSASQIHVIPHIAIGERNAESVETDDNEVLFFGRIWPYKGLEYLIRAQPLINREVPDARIVICGQGEDMERYRRMMSDPTRFVVNNRWITDSERTEYFQRASVVVLPYVEASQSGVVPVAYAHSKPVVVTQIGGLPDAVEAERTGLLVPPANEEELAKAIVRLLKDRELRRSMGAAGYRKLKSEFSPYPVCQRTADVYRLAIAGRKAAGKSANASFSRQL